MITHPYTMLLFQVINFYFNLLMDRSKKCAPTIHIFNTFFYPRLLKVGHQGLARWTRRVGETWHFSNVTFDTAPYILNFWRILKNPEETTDSPNWTSICVAGGSICSGPNNDPHSFGNALVFSCHWQQSQVHYLLRFLAGRQSSMHKCFAVSSATFALKRLQLIAELIAIIRPVFAVNGTTPKHSLATSKILSITRAKRQTTWHFVNASVCARLWCIWLFGPGASILL